jgi:hemicentin
MLISLISVQQLTLLHAGLADGGKYVCRASNVAGHSEVDLSLRVLVPPQIDESNLVHNPLAILGKEIFLECPASGIPQPTVTWQREGEPIQPDGRFSLQQVCGCNAMAFN